jgi:hypothetical protein
LQFLRAYRQASRYKSFEGISFVVRRIFALKLLREELNSIKGSEMESIFVICG